MPPNRRGGGGDRQQGVKKGAWSPEEDEVLRQHVREHGEKDWSSIRSKGLLRRTGKSCRLRWVNKLHPGLRGGKFSPEEERVVLDLQAQLGNRWAMIATRLPGRTDNDVKNFWSSRQKRLARLLQELPPRKRDVRKNGRSSHDRLVQQEPNSSMIAFQATTYNTDQNRSQEPREVKHRSDTLLPKAVYLPAPGELTVHAAMEHGSSSTTVPFCKTYPESPVRGTRADLASLHYAAFIEPLAVASAPLSFGPAPFYDSPNNEPHPPQVILSDPFLEDQYFTAAALHRNKSEVHFDDLTPEVLDFFSHP